jgi:hypothetical protein
MSIHEFAGTVPWPVAMFFAAITALAIQEWEKKRIKVESPRRKAAMALGTCIGGVLLIFFVYAFAIS